MTNLYIPKNICPNCFADETKFSGIIWSYDETKSEVECPWCHNIIKKRLHNLIGANISKDIDGNYVLAFPEYKETNIYPEWKDLQEEMEKLAKND